VMRAHPLLGAQLIGDDPSDVLGMARDIALCHHERWDGTGYPSGLAGEQIPLAARIVAIADCFDAMTSPRPYRVALSEDDAAAHIRAGAGTAFEPRLVDAFVRALPRILRMRQRWVREVVGTPEAALVAVEAGTADARR
jgi:putative two-component system response regulator